MTSQVILFACSKCFSRHPFEELSPGQQLCKVNKPRNLEFTKFYVSIQGTILLSSFLPVIQNIVMLNLIIYLIKKFQFLLVICVYVAIFVIKQKLFVY